MKFATELSEPAFAARPLIRDTDARTLAREILQMTPESYATAFRGSAIKRAKLWMLQRNACVVLGNVGTCDDVPVLEAMDANENVIVREQSAWSAARLETDRLS